MACALLDTAQVATVWEHSRSKALTARSNMATCKHDEVEHSDDGNRSGGNFHLYGQPAI